MTTRAMTADLQLPATLRPGRAKIALLFVGCLLFTLGGLWMTREGERIGYFVAGVFGIGLLVSVILFIPGAAYLRLTPEGFTFCSLFQAQTFGWGQVLRFGMVRVNIWMVAWNFRPDHRPAGSARALSKSICGYDAALPDTYGLKPEELLELMESLRQKYAHGPGV